MSRIVIYLDESGDLGWSMDRPYKRGGSSRMLTLAAVCLPIEKVKYLQRIVRAIYKKRKRPLSNELKSVYLNHTDKELFLRLTLKLLKEHEDIKLGSITVRKEGVSTRLKQDPNTLYNYMAKCLLLKSLCRTKYVDFIPDRRSEKINIKWNIGEYLQQMLSEESINQGFINQSCNVTPMDSSNCLELQFIDFYVGLVWARYEFQEKRLDAFMAEAQIVNKKLFFIN